MEKKTIPIYDLFIDPNSDEFELKSIDPVFAGAIERDYIFYSDDNLKEIKFSHNTEQRITTGPVMIPDRLIYKNYNGFEYYTRISAEQILNSVKSLFKNKNGNNVQLDHEGQLIEGVYLIESWIVNDPLIDKSAQLGFKDIPKGTHFASYYFDNKSIWDTYIKTGRLNGYSINGYYQLEFLKNIEIPIPSDLQFSKLKFKNEISILNEKIKNKTIY